MRAEVKWQKLNVQCQGVKECASPTLHQCIDDNCYYRKAAQAWQHVCYASSIWAGKCKHYAEYITLPPAPHIRSCSLDSSGFMLQSSSNQSISINQNAGQECEQCVVHSATFCLLFELALRFGSMLQAQLTHICLIAFSICCNHACSMFNYILDFCCLQTCFLLFAWSASFLKQLSSKAQTSCCDSTTRRVLAPLNAIQDDPLQRAAARVLHSCALLM